MKADNPYGLRVQDAIRHTNEMVTSSRTSSLRCPGCKTERVRSSAGRSNGRRLLFWTLSHATMDLTPSSIGASTRRRCLVQGLISQGTAVSQKRLSTTTVFESGHYLGLVPKFLTWTWRSGHERLGRETARDFVRAAAPTALRVQGRGLSSWPTSLTMCGQPARIARSDHSSARSSRFADAIWRIRFSAALASPSARCSQSGNLVYGSLLNVHHACIAQFHWQFGMGRS